MTDQPEVPSPAAAFARGGQRFGDALEFGLQLLQALATASAPGRLALRPVPVVSTDQPLDPAYLRKGGSMRDASSTVVPDSFELRGRRFSGLDILPREEATPL